MWENSSNCKNNNNICEDRKAIELNDGVIRHKERIRKDVIKIKEGQDQMV